MTLAQVHWPSVGWVSGLVFVGLVVVLCLCQAIPKRPLFDGPHGKKEKKEGL